MMLNLPPTTLKNLLLSVGNRGGKRPLSPIEVAQAMALAISRGSSANEVATALHLAGTTMIGRFTRLLDLPSDVQLATDWGRTSSTLSFTSAYEISGLKDSEEQSEVCHAALEHGLTADEIRSLVQLRKRGAPTVATAITEVLRGRSTVVRRHLIVGSVPPGLLREKLSDLSQLSRDDVLHRVIAERYRLTAGADMSPRLGVDRFTISCDEATGSTLLRDSEGFEAGILKDLETTLLSSGATNR